MAMASKLSAGLLLYKVEDGVLRVLIAHMGGPFWAKKDLRAWSIPKGEYDDGEDPRVVATREFEEETGASPPDDEWLELGTVRQPSGKQITAFAVEGEFDTSSLVSNTFEIEWPKGSGTIQAFPEIDRAEWYDANTARDKLVKGQIPFIDQLIKRLQDAEIEISERSQEDQKLF
jgi:predicted NUDIX family NTP pyrophosphohydrolase